MAEKTKLQLQIEASEKKIQEEQQRLKLLERKQTERDRKDRSHRLCKRHSYLESVIPDTINLTDEQFQDFVKQHIANRHGLAVMNGRTKLPIADWQMEQKELAAKRHALCDEYYALKEEIPNMEAIRRSIEGLMKDEPNRAQPKRTMDALL